MHSGFVVAADGRGTEECSLRGTDGSVSAIVEDEELDGQVMLRYRGQLLNVQLEASVTINTNRSTMSARNRSTDAGRDCESHPAQSGGVKHLSPAPEFVRQEEDLNPAARTARHDELIRGNQLGHDLCKMVNAHPAGQAMFGKHDRV